MGLYLYLPLIMVEITSASCWVVSILPWALRKKAMPWAIFLCIFSSPYFQIILAMDCSSSLLTTSAAVIVPGSLNRLNSQVRPYFQKWLTKAYCGFILISKGPSWLIEKPLLGVSNCIEEAPASNKAASMLSSSTPASLSNTEISENLPFKGKTRPLNQRNKFWDLNRF